MNFLTRYITYLKDNPHHYWFRRKAYGWGWVPVRWQGWLVVILFILFSMWNALTLPPHADPTTIELLWFFIKTITAVAAIILICYKTGEKPRWQWGLPDRNEKP